MEFKPAISLVVAFYNTKTDKHHPVNIQQKEEQNAFIEFVKDFMAEVIGYCHVMVTGKALKLFESNFGNVRLNITERWKTRQML